jgi:hypothetical protein
MNRSYGWVQGTNPGQGAQPPPGVGVDPNLWRATHEVLLGVFSDYVKRKAGLQQQQMMMQQQQQQQQHRQAMNGDGVPQAHSMQQYQDQLRHVQALRQQQQQQQQQMFHMNQQSRAGMSSSASVSSGPGSSGKKNPVPDCGKCCFCKEKARFGGPGKVRSKCILKQRTPVGMTSEQQRAEVQRVLALQAEQAAREAALREKRAARASAGGSGSVSVQASGAAHVTPAVAPAVAVASVPPPAAATGATASNSTAAAAKGKKGTTTSTTSTTKKKKKKKKKGVKGSESSDKKGKKGKKKKKKVKKKGKTTGAGGKSGTAAKAGSSPTSASGKGSKAVARRSAPAPPPVRRIPEYYEGPRTLLYSNINLTIHVPEFLGAKPKDIVATKLAEMAANNIDPFADLARVTLSEVSVATFLSGIEQHLALKAEASNLFGVEVGDRMWYFPEGHAYANRYCEDVLAHNVLSGSTHALFGPKGEIRDVENMEPLLCEVVAVSFHMDMNSHVDYAPPYAQYTLKHVRNKQGGLMDMPRWYAGCSPTVVPGKDLVPKEGTGAMTTKPQAQTKATGDDAAVAESSAGGAATSSNAATVTTGSSDGNGEVSATSAPVESAGEGAVDGQKESDKAAANAATATAPTAPRGDMVICTVQRARIATVFATIVEKLMQVEELKPLALPVSEALYPDYQRVVKRPLHLGQILDRARAGMFANTVEFVADIELLVKNTLYYFHWEHRFGLSLPMAALSMLSKVHKMLVHPEALRVLCQTSDDDAERTAKPAPAPVPLTPPANQVSGTVDGVGGVTATGAGSANPAANAEQEEATLVGENGGEPEDTWEVVVRPTLEGYFPTYLADSKVVEKSLGEFESSPVSVGDKVQRYQNPGSKVAASGGFVQGYRPMTRKFRLAWASLVVAWFSVRKGRSDPNDYIDEKKHVRMHINPWEVIKKKEEVALE